MFAMMETNISDLKNPEIFDKIEEISHLRAVDVEMIARFCLANDVVIAVRTPGDRVRHLLEHGCLGKGLTIKAKTASMGSIMLQGLLPIHQSFSKLSAKSKEVFDKIQKDLINKLEEDAKTLEYMKSEVQEGCDYRDIARLQLIVEQPLLNERGQQIYGVFSNNYDREGCIQQYVFGHVDNGFLYLENGEKISTTSQHVEAIPITIAAYITDIVLNEREAIDVYTKPITSDYDLALIACRSNEVNAQTKSQSLKELYPIINKFSAEDQNVLQNRGYGTILDHVVLAALVTKNLSINHAPDTGNPHPEGLDEPWFAILPQYCGDHPLYQSDEHDTITISNLLTRESKLKFFAYLEKEGYNFPYNPQWIGSGYRISQNEMMQYEGQNSPNFIVADHKVAIAQNSFISYVRDAVCGCCYGK